ncbi:hypothetical protein RvY_01197 [Ramazzottius varieornatus]|uniref:ZP domain-containing protein n=1 Tax=Ramazzottius varieornatus TaxID=947166 RepID=A0A1D1UJ10_RAMVA|nr:hypothetical protein RvY_01197 [Ramazzottius varieornatus]
MYPWITVIAVFGGLIFVEAKEPLNITCKMDARAITVEIYTTRPLYDVQLKNSDQACDPQEFTENSIRFVIQNYQLGRCGFSRSTDSQNGLDGTFWNNLLWKEKPHSTKTSITKIKCAHKLSEILKNVSPVIHIQLVPIPMPFGAFPNAFGPGGPGAFGSGGPGGMPPMPGPEQLEGAPPSPGLEASHSGMPSGMMSPFPPGISGMPGGMGPRIIFLRGGPPPTMTGAAPAPAELPVVQ